MFKFSFFSWLFNDSGVPLCVCTQSCLTLWLVSSSVHGIFQSRILEWVAISFSRGSSWPRDWTHISFVLHWQAVSLPPGRLGVPISTQIFLNLRISCDFFLYLCFIVYLAVSGLSCSTRELCCGMWVFVASLRASLVLAGGLRSLGAACRIFSLWCQGLAAPWPVGF